MKTKYLVGISGVLDSTLTELAAKSEAEETFVPFTHTDVNPEFIKALENVPPDVTIDVEKMTAEEFIALVMFLFGAK